MNHRSNSGVVVGWLLLVTGAALAWMLLSLAYDAGLIR
jgi:hypothetical protein